MKDVISLIDQIPIENEYYIIIDQIPEENEDIYH